MALNSGQLQEGTIEIKPSFIEECIFNPYFQPLTPFFQNSCICLMTNTKK